MIRKPLEKHEIPDAMVVDLGKQDMVPMGPLERLHHAIWATCPYCESGKWVRASYIRSGHTKTSKCRDCYYKTGANFLPMTPDEHPGDGYILHFDRQELKIEKSNGKQMAYILTECPHCGDERWARVNRIRAKKIKSTMCQSCAQSNRVHELRKGGVQITAGYREIHIRTLSDEDRELVILSGRNRKRSYIYEHVFVALKKYGIEAVNKPGIVVRHVNGDKLDNSPENLILGTQGDNARDHVDAVAEMKIWRGLAVFLWGMITQKPNSSPLLRQPDKIHL